MFQHSCLYVTSESGSEPTLRIIALRAESINHSNVSPSFTCKISVSQCSNAEMLGMSRSSQCGWLLGNTNDDPNFCALVPWAL